MWPGLIPISGVSHIHIRTECPPLILPPLYGKYEQNCLHCWPFWSRVQNIHRNTRLSSRSNHYRHNTGLSKKKCLCLKMFHIFYYPLLLLRSFAGQRQNRIPQRSRVASHRYVNYLQVSVTNDAVRDHKDTNSPWKSRLHSVLVIVLALQGKPPHIYL